MKMKYRYVIHVVILLLFIPSTSYSRHIIGGEMSYTCLGNGDYEIEMIQYRDCDGGGAPFDEEAPISIFECGNTRSCTDLRQGNQIEFIRVPIESVTEILVPDSICIIKKLCVQKATYRFRLSDYDISLPLSNQNYYIVYQRCCRTEDITNIVRSGDTGRTYSVEITTRAQSVCNTSSKFIKNPPIFICNNKEITLDLSVIDPDGDSLIYEFISPLDGGGPDLSSFGASLCSGASPDPPCPPPFDRIRFNEPNFTSAFPFGISRNSMRLNSQTGIISGIPEIQGIIEVGIAVSEYREGDLINIIEREFQVFVGDCSNARTDIVAPKLEDDEFQIKSSDIIHTINVLDNDIVSEDVNYTIKIFEENSDLDFTVLDGGDITVQVPSLYTGKVSFQYEVCYEQCSVFCDFATVDLDISIYEKTVNGERFPEAFTPNGDGINDTFVIPSIRDRPENYPNNELIVINRWGDQVYHAKPYTNTWDGTYKGKTLPAGTYYFIMRLDLSKGNIIRGNVTLLR